LIDALGNGLPVGSVTLPVTVVFCANTPVNKNNRHGTRSTSFLMC
jgi:hypothetical protein